MWYLPLRDGLRPLQVSDVGFDGHVLVQDRAEPVLGTSQTLTASFHNVTPPVGSAVLFQISGANAQVKLGRTNADGVATVRYTGHIPGTDSVTAMWISDPGQNEATLTSNVVKIAWAAPPVGAWGEMALKVLMFLVALIAAPVTLRSRKAGTAS